MSMRREGPLAITFIIGIYMILEYYIQLPVQMKPIGTMIQNWAVVVVAASIGVGAISTFLQHFNKVIKKTPGQWQYSVVLILAIILFIGVGLIFSTYDAKWNWLYQSIMLPLYATTYSLWAFYMASSAYRAFRVRNVDAAILLISGSLVMIGNVPIGEIIWDMFPLIREWIMSVPNMSANRGIMIGAALGAIILGFRTLIGRETGYLGSKEKGE